MNLSRAEKPILQFTDGKGHPCSGGYLHTYVGPDTVNPVATYADQEGTKNPVKIPLDSDGRTQTEVWLDTTMTYKFVVTDRQGNVILTVNGVRSNVSTFVAQGSDTIEATETTEDGKTIVTFSVKDGSIGKEQLKAPRPFIPDSAYIQFKTFGDNIVVTLSDKLQEWLTEQGFVADE